MQAMEKFLRQEFPSAYRLALIDPLFTEPYLLLGESFLVGVAIRMEKSEVVLQPIIPTSFSSIPGIYFLGSQGRVEYYKKMRDWFRGKDYEVQAYKGNGLGF